MYLYFSSADFNLTVGVQFSLTPPLRPLVRLLLTSSARLHTFWTQKEYFINVILGNRHIFTRGIFLIFFACLSILNPFVTTCSTFFDPDYPFPPLLEEQFGLQGAIRLQGVRPTLGSK